MKKLTIITTIVLMLAFVLPMAQAQDKPATEDNNSDSIKTEEQTSQSENTTEAEQKLKQNQQQLSKNMQELEFRLQQLQIQKQKLEKELQAMVQARQAEVQARQAEVQAAQAKIKAKQAEIKAKEVKEKSEKAKYKAAEAKASADAHKAEAHAKHMEQWAKEMEAWAKQYQAQMNSPEAQEKIKHLANNWVHKWVNSDEFKQWQKAMDLWAKEQADMHEKAKSGDGAPTSTHESHPMPVMPPMPPMPPVSVAPVPLQAKNEDKQLKDRSGEVLITSVFIKNDLALEVLPSIAKQAGISIIPDESVTGFITCELKDVPLDTALDIILAGTPYTYKKTKYYYLVCPGKIAGPAPVLPNTTGTKSNIEIKKDKDGKYIATTEMHFVSKVQPGNPFVIRNNLGNIILKPSKDDTCDVRAVIRGKDKNQAKARAMVEQVSMNLHSSDERYYLKPVKSDGEKWSNLSVDLYITVPAGIQPDVKTDLGNIEISNLKGNVKAFTDLGSIKAINTTGNIELFTKMGKIEFIAPKNLSAKLKAYTKMGEIQSELPLEVSKIDMFKRTAEGTIGSGRASIKIATDMGKISLKWQPSSQDEIKL